MKNEKIIILLLGFFLLSGSFAFGQAIVTDENSLFGADESTGITTDENSLFGNDADKSAGESTPLVEEVTDNQTKDLSSVLLTSKSGVDIGGEFFFDTTSVWSGINPDDILGSSIVSGFSLDLGATLFLDARPDEDTRIFAKADITSPFYTIDGTAQTERRFEDIVTIKELFTDFNWNKQLFFRAGKQTVNWGVGYFFSPADLLSLGRIDPEDPDVDLEGPIALKINYPYKSNNYYLYTVVPSNVDSHSDIAVAPMAEFVIGKSEISLGAYYQYDNAPAAMTTVTSAIGDVSVYGEGYVSYGSDKTFVADNGFSTIRYDDTLFFKGTVGASYSWSDDLSNYNLSFSGQYYYNGEGYKNQDLLKTPMVLSLDKSDLIETGRHYGAASASWKDMWGSDFSLSVFFIENFSSFSGMVKPSLSWSGLDNIDITLSATRMFGDAGEEYSIAGSTASVSLGVSIGGTSF